MGVHTVHQENIKLSHRAPLCSTCPPQHLLSPPVFLSASAMRRALGLLVLGVHPIRSGLAGRMQLAWMSVPVTGVDACGGCWRVSLCKVTFAGQRQLRCTLLL